MGYGILGVALGTIVGLVGLDQDEVSGNSVAMGMLGFLLLFTVAVCAYAALLPEPSRNPWCKPPTQTRGRDVCHKCPGHGDKGSRDRGSVRENTPKREEASGGDAD
ncbi:hypothetical protein NHF46_02435 [Arthrobacter alpinus]|nr:hypothetical protein [Arthrobacter alpinus]